ncbi:hypothetical protein JW916_04615 [Candidatus Sumerlaeota bacterium]|nr:hypothetical protein [Candidatus Sumerlaeota bacterium]
MPFAFLVLGLCFAVGPSSVAAALDLGGALDKVGKGVEEAKKAVDGVTQTATTPDVPSGAATYLRQADRQLDKMDEIMADRTPDRFGETRVKKAEACLKAAKEAVATVEKRHGAKMGMDHPELVARRDRIAGCEETLEEFRTAMAATPAESVASDETAPATAAAPAAEESAPEAPAAPAPAAQAPKAAPPTAATGGDIPSGAATLLRQVDQKLDRLDKMMSDESANYDKDYRVEAATSHLKEAREAMDTLEKRHGSKVGMDRPEIAQRRDRIAASERALAAFQGTMAEAMKSEEEAEAARRKAEADAYAAQKAEQEAAETQRIKDNEEAMRKASQIQIGGGKILFSKSPIDPANPSNLTTSFQAGDTIYGLIQSDKPWREVYNAKDKSELGLLIFMEIGDSKTNQYITLKKPEYIDSAELVLDIAPDPGKMTAYKNPDIEFGEGKGNRKIGPIAFTYELSQLPAGKHTVSLYLRNYGEKPAVGEFEIEGSDFSFYADLNQKLAAATDAMATMPPAGMVNRALEDEMRALLANAGWTDIRRLVIVDKDWWIDYVGETGSPVKSRHMDAAVATKGDDGQFYYCICQFHQPMLITGAWGKLELTSTGRKRPIAEENIDK